jgi:hypothetical protein
MAPKAPDARVGAVKPTPQEAIRPSATAHVSQPVGQPAVANATSKPASIAALDLAALEQRLRNTRAVGVFTKLSLKNQVDDLLEQFRNGYRAQKALPLTPLRQQYDLLLLKVLTLLQDGDPPLATAIAASREAIWSVLADPQKFSAI